VVTRENRAFPEHLHFPVVVKAPCEGSTVGIVKISSAEKWDESLDDEFKFADELLVEEFIKGTEISVPVLNAEVLEVIEIVPPTDFYDWDAKYVYNNGETQYFTPPRSLPEAVIKLAKEYALKFYHAAGCRDILRVDFIVDADGVPRVLEGNNLPGNTDHSLVPKAARHAGMSMEKMAALMVYCAMKRSGESPLSQAALPEKCHRNIAGKVFNTFGNLTAFCAGAVLVLTGIIRNEWNKSTTAVLLIGGILLALFALCRQFDRRQWR
jgi:hypothetical protein